MRTLARCHYSYVSIRGGTARYVDMAKQRVTLPAGLARAMKSQRHQPERAHSWEGPKSAQRTCCIEVTFSTALAVLIPKKDGLKLCLATLLYNAIYFLIPLDFETALIHTKWSKTQMYSISTPKTLQLHIAGWFPPPLENGKVLHLEMKVFKD